MFIIVFIFTAPPMLDIILTAIGDFTFNQERYSVATGSVEFWKEHLTFLYSEKFSRTHVYWTAFLDVFRSGLWWVVCSTMFLFVVYFTAIKTFITTRTPKARYASGLVGTLTQTVSLIFRAFACLDTGAQVLVDNQIYQNTLIE